MYSPIQRPAYFLLLFSLFLGSCSIFSGDEDSPDINDPVPHANGMYIPESCGEQGDSLELVGHLDLQQKDITDIWGYYDAESEREYALLGFQETEETSGGFFVVDVTDPTNPDRIVVNKGVGSAQDIAVWKNFMYTVTGHSDDGKGMIYANPASPGKRGEFPSGHNLFITDTGYLLVADPGVKVYDLVPDPTDPKLIWSSGLRNGHDVAVVDNMLFDFHGFDGTILYDFSDPHEPVRMKTLDHDSVRFHHSGWISPNGEYLYINDELPANLNKRKDISIWNIETNEMIGAYRDTTSTVHNSYTVCDRLVVSYYMKGLVLFDISDPTQLTLLDEYDTTPAEDYPGYFLGAWGVFPYTHSGNIMVSDVNNGLYVFRVK